MHCVRAAKGQLISKCLFCIFNSPNKTNENIQLYYYGTSSRIVFVRFLGVLKTQKRHFKMNWPLHRPKSSIWSWFMSFFCGFSNYGPSLRGTTELCHWKLTLLNTYRVSSFEKDILFTLEMVMSDFYLLRSVAERDWVLIPQLLKPSRIKKGRKWCS